MKFAEPWALLALLLVPAVLLGWWLDERRRRAKIARAGDPALFERLLDAGRGGGAGLRLARAILLSLALALVSVALARPQFGLRTELRKARGMDVVIALDLSRSMLARDVVPSRLERARIELSDLLDRLEGDRVGLVGFTSIALPLSPLTIDHAAVKLQLRSAEPDDMPRGGTSIADAVQAGLRMLEAAPESGGAKAIVVVTDGEEHEGDPEAAAQEAAEQGVEVHVVGVGSRTGEPIPLTDASGKVTGYLKDRRGQTVVTRLGESMLKKIAAAGSGLVALPGEQGGLDLGPVRRHLGAQKKAELTDRVVRIYEERYRWFLLPAAILLLLATLLRPSRRVTRMITSGLMLLALPATGLAQALESEDPDAAAARRALTDGKAEEAAKAYQKAIDRLGERPELLYDLGLAEAARGELDAAISRFRQAQGLAEDPNLRGKAAYAMGNAYRALKKYDEAMTAYREALVEDPGLTGARRNLELTRAMKAVAAAQPKPPNEDGDKSDENEDPPPEQDGGVSDGGGDGGPPDAGPQDGGDGDGGGQSEGQDAGTDQDGGGDGDEDGGGGSDGGSSGPPDAGAGGEDDGGASSGGEDGGAGDAQAAQPNADNEPEDGDDEDLEKQQVEQLLDALQEQEKALERERLKQKYKGKNVEKDW